MTVGWDRVNRRPHHGRLISFRHIGRGEPIAVWVVELDRGAVWHVEERYLKKEG